MAMLESARIVAPGPLGLLTAVQHDGRHRFVPSIENVRERLGALHLARDGRVALALSDGRWLSFDEDLDPASLVEAAPATFEDGLTEEPLEPARVGIFTSTPVDVHACQEVRVAPDPHRRCVLFSAGTGRLVIRSLWDGSVVAETDQPRARVYSVGVSDGGEACCSMDEGGELIVWHPESWEPRARCRPLDGLAIPVGWTMTVASGSRLPVFERISPAVESRFTVDPLTLDLHRDQRLVVMAPRGRSLTGGGYQLEGACIIDPRDPQSPTAALSVDGTRGRRRGETPSCVGHSGELLLWESGGLTVMSSDLTRVQRREHAWPLSGLEAVGRRGDQLVLLETTGTDRAPRSRVVQAPGHVLRAAVATAFVDPEAGPADPWERILDRRRDGSVENTEREIVPRDPDGVILESRALEPPLEDPDSAGWRIASGGGGPSWVTDTFTFRRANQHRSRGRSFQDSRSSRSTRAGAAAS